MMIRLNKINILIAGIMVLCSCSKILEVKPISQITNQVFWQNEEDYSTYLVGIYQKYRGHMNELAFGDDRGDGYIQGVVPRFSLFWSQFINAGNSRDWTSFYGTIGHINLLLSKIANFPFTDLKAKQRIQAEALCIRAAMYFHLAKIWGDVPLMLEPVVDENVPLLPRAPVAEVFNQIFADLDLAVSYFPEGGFLNKNRLSKPAAYALIADARIWKAKVLNGGAPDYEIALSEIQGIENSGLSLLPVFRDIFTSTNKRNAEIIFSLYFDRSETKSTMYSCLAMPFGSSTSNESVPYVSDPTNGQGGYTASPEIRKIIDRYENDQRKSVSYLRVTTGDEEGFSWPNKFRGTLYNGNRFADDDVIVYRFAEILLFKAEAFAALGRLDESLQVLNMVRQRAGIKDMQMASKSEIEQEILDERARELFHENKRWWDLHRFHAGGTIDVYQVVPNLRGKDTPLYWPVATRVLSLNPNIAQTEGY